MRKKFVETHKKKDFEKKLRENDDWKYYKKVDCHRTFLLAMSMYKFKKYGEKNITINEKANQP